MVLQRIADEVFDGILDHFVYQCHDGSGENIFAYTFDPSKPVDHPAHHRRYYDSNDMPTVLAYEWGFLSLDGAADSPCGRNHGGLRTLWEKTLTWAFTPDPRWTADRATRARQSTPGCNGGYAGDGTEPFHGLGSDYSEGAWVLGFYQEWKFARTMGDAGREARAWEKIRGAMQWDGTFSEAVDVQSGECMSKTWFSWPGAMIAAELIETVVAQTRASAAR